MPIVLDCSVTMAWCFADEADPYADAVLETLATEEARVPAIWTLEVTNVLLGAERHGRIRAADTARFLALLGELPIQVVAHDAPAAFGNLLACGRRFELTAYDAAYLDLAMRAGVRLATRDERLRQACIAAGVELFPQA